MARLFEIDILFNINTWSPTGGVCGQWNPKNHWISTTVRLKSNSIDDYEKPYKVNIGNENTFEELSHAFISIEIVNHEASVTRFISSKQWYGSCEQRFGTTTLLSEDIIIDEGKFNVSNKN